jgi:hypothetical protein
VAEVALVDPGREDEVVVGKRLLLLALVGDQDPPAGHVDPGDLEQGDARVALLAERVRIGVAMSPGDSVEMAT